MAVVECGWEAVQFKMLRRPKQERVHLNPVSATFQEWSAGCKWLDLSGCLLLFKIALTVLI